MFERFTKDARAVVVTAQQVAVELGHPAMGDEHMLLALLANGGPAADLLHEAGATEQSVRGELVRLHGPKRDEEALRAIGIDLQEVQARAQATFGPGALRLPSSRRRRLPGRRAARMHVPLSFGAKQALEQGLRAAMELRSSTIGAEHLLLGLLAIENGAAVLVLRRLDVSLDRVVVRDAVGGERRRSA